MKCSMDTTAKCKSIFYSGEATTKERYTQVWIRLIDQLEKSKSVLTGIQ